VELPFPKKSQKNGLKKLPESNRSFDRVGAKPFLVRFKFDMFFNVFNCEEMIFDGTNVPGSRAEKNGIDQPEL
jgi:hypothetical protein